MESALLAYTKDHCENNDVIIGIQREYSSSIDQHQPNRLVPGYISGVKLMIYADTDFFVNKNDESNLL